MPRASLTLGLSTSVATLTLLGTFACGSSDTSRHPTTCTGNCTDAGDSGGSRGNGTGGGSGNGGVKASSGGTAGSTGAATGGVSGSGNGGGGNGNGNGNGGRSAGAGGTGSGTPDASIDGAVTDSGAEDSGRPPTCVSNIPDAGATSCAAGTADCDGNASDCETNTATDPTNCGRCHRVCGATAACTNGLCAATVLLDPPAGVASNWCGGAFSATKAYMITCWGNSDLSEVRVAPLEPGASVDGTRIRSYADVTVVALRGILIDGNDVYYGLEGKTGVASNLWKFPLDATGTNDVTLGVAMEVGLRFDDLQLVGSTYYWESNNHTVAGQIVPAEIYKRGKGDSASTLLVSTLGVTYNLQVTPTKLLWLEGRTSGGVHVYRSPLAGVATAGIEDVATAAAGSAMTRQGDYVYWTLKSAAPSGKIYRLATEYPGAAPEEVATGLNLPEGIVADAEYVYFKQLDALYRVPHCGGTPEQLSPVVPANDTQATAIYRVDDRYVYFAAGSGFGDSTLVRVAK